LVFKPIISLIIAFLFHSVLIWAFKFSVLTSLISFLVCYTIEMSYFDQFSFNLDQVFKRFYYYYLKEEWYFPKVFLMFLFNSPSFLFLFYWFVIWLWWSFILFITFTVFGKDSATNFVFLPFDCFVFLL